jgi:hypothetical protein
MKKNRALLLFCAMSLCAPEGQAGPRQVLRKTARVLANHVTLDGLALTSSGFSAYGTVHCRGRNGPEPCAEHYGAYKQGIAADAGLTIGMIFLSEYGRKQGFKEWFLPAAATLAGNTIFGVRELHTKSKPEKRP